jgi:hypothetical protein
LSSTTARKSARDNGEEKGGAGGPAFFLSRAARLTGGGCWRSIVFTKHPAEKCDGLEINDDAKEIVQELGAAINSAVERSPEVAEAIERLRDAGYELELTLRLEIGLRENAPRGGDDDEEPARLELTDEDLRTLRSMKIRFDEQD